MTMPDMQTSETRKILRTIENGWLYRISDYATSNKQEVQYRTLMEDELNKAEQLIATHQRRAVIEGKIEELRRIELAQQDEDKWSNFCMDDSSDFGNYITSRIAQLEKELGDLK